MNLRIVPLVFAACASQAAAGIGDDERRIVDFVAAHATEQVALLREAVDIESPTQDLAGVRRAGALFARELTALGFAVRWIDAPAALQRAGHLVAQHPGTSGQRLLLIGHLDTVLRGEPFRVDGTRAYGTGTLDMKSGDVVMVSALKALAAAGVLDAMRITVVLTGDEENPGQPLDVARHDLVAAAQDADLALCFEETIRNTATVGRRGQSTWRVDVAAATGHSSQVFGAELGDGAVYEAARILERFHATFRGEKYLTLNPSVIVGGTTSTLDDPAGSAAGKTNVIAGSASMRGDLRFMTIAQRDAARERMRAIVGASLPRTSAKIAFEDGYPPMAPAPGNYALLDVLKRVSADLGAGEVEALDPGQRGAGDIAFVAGRLPGLDGIGGRGGGSHAPGEWVELASLPMLTQRAALVMYRLTR